MGRKVNIAAHKVAHALAQREIAKCKPNWNKTRQYWNNKVREARRALLVAWSEEHLPNEPLEQNPLPGIYSEDP